MTDDGRLDLDDLGQVVERATPLDAPARDELSGGSEGPTWSERTEPARGWVRRHRIVVAAVTTSAVVLGIGAAAWTVRQPPPPDTELDVLLLFPVDRVGVEFLEDSVVQLSVRADSRRDGESVRVLGVVGTGLTASRAWSAGPGTFEVRAVVDCSLEPGLVTGTAATEHLVEVETTDAYGRTLRGRLPMVGVSDSLGLGLSQHCAQVMADRGVTTQVTTARRDGSDLALTVSVRNDTPHRVVLSTAPTTGTIAVSAPVVGVAAGRSRFWSVRLALTDCAAPQLPWVAPDGTWVEIEGATLLDDEWDDVDDVDDVEPMVDAQVGFVAGSTVQDPVASLYEGPSYRQIRLGAVSGSIRAWVRAVCGGAEPVRVSARPDGPARPVAEGPSRVAIPVALEVRVPATGRTTIAPVADQQDAWAMTLSPLGAPDEPWSASPAPGARTATYRVLWMLSCTADLFPLRIDAIVRTEGRATPWRLVLDDVVLADALIRACPVEAGSYDALTGWGWDLADASTGGSP